MTLYAWLTAAAASCDPQDIHIDLSEKTLCFRSMPILQKGELCAQTLQIPDGSAIQFDALIDTSDNPYEEVEALYAVYKRSVPGKHDRMDKGNFKAYSSDSLSYAELEQNTPRHLARVALEAYVLLAAAAGVIRWQNPKHFFWRGSDPDLILYRMWIDKEETL